MARKQGRDDVRAVLAALRGTFLGMFEERIAKLPRAKQREAWEELHADVQVRLDCLADEEEAGR